MLCDGTGIVGVRVRKGFEVTGGWFVRGHRHVVTLRFIHLDVLCKIVVLSRGIFQHWKQFIGREK